MDYQNLSLQTILENASCDPFASISMHPDGYHGSHTFHQLIFCFLSFFSGYHSCFIDWPCFNCSCSCFLLLFLFLFLLCSCYYHSCIILIRVLALILELLVLILDLVLILEFLFLSCSCSWLVLLLFMFLFLLAFFGSYCYFDCLILWSCYLYILSLSDPFSCSCPCFV